MPPPGLNCCAILTCLASLKVAAFRTPLVGLAECSDSDEGPGAEADAALPIGSRSVRDRLETGCKRSCAFPDAVTEGEGAFPVVVSVSTIVMGTRLRFGTTVDDEAAAAGTSIGVFYILESFSRCEQVLK